MALHRAWGTFQGLTCLSKVQDALIFKSLEKNLIVFHQLGGMAEVLWLLETVFFLFFYNLQNEEKKEQLAPLHRTPGRIEGSNTYKPLHKSSYCQLLFCFVVPFLEH